MGRRGPIATVDGVAWDGTPFRHPPLPEFVEVVARGFEKIFRSCHGCLLVLLYEKYAPDLNAQSVNTFDVDRPFRRECIHCPRFVDCCAIYLASRIRRRKCRRSGDAGRTHALARCSGRCHLCNPSGQCRMSRVRTVKAYSDVTRQILSRIQRIKSPACACRTFLATRSLSDVSVASMPEET